MTQEYSGDTGKAYIESEPNELTCENGTWLGKRVWLVKTSSPYVAIMTVQCDADVPVGRLYDEECDDDYEAYDGNPPPPLRAHTFTTERAGEYTRVTVEFRDDRQVVNFDELSPGFKQSGITTSLVSVEVEQTLGPYKRWDSSGNPNCIGWAARYENLAAFEAKMAAITSGRRKQGLSPFLCDTIRRSSSLRRVLKSSLSPSPSLTLPPHPERDQNQMQPLSATLLYRTWYRTGRSQYRLAKLVTTTGTGTTQPSSLCMLFCCMLPTDAHAPCAEAGLHNVAHPAALARSRTSDRI
jgi:hypothetical protein